MMYYIFIDDYTDHNYKTGINKLDKLFIKNLKKTRNMEELKRFTDRPYYQNLKWMRIGIKISLKLKSDEVEGLILSEKYYLYDIKTIKKFNLNIDQYYISDVCRHGAIDVLDYLDNLGYRYDFSSSIELTGHYNSISVQFVYNRVAVLEWLKKSGSFSTYDFYENYNALICKWGFTPIDVASYGGHTEVLDWWKCSGILSLGCAPGLPTWTFSTVKKNVSNMVKCTGYFSYGYTKDSLCWASSRGHINVLNWWKNSGLGLIYNEETLDTASENGHVNVLTWWLNSNLPLKYSKKSLDNALKNGHVNVLEWWNNYGLPINP